ncbi:paralemmin-3 isoform X2 [Castor canadensis]
MAESSLYRQRLEVIAEKRRLQEAIGAARRELEEEKLRVQRLKRKSLRERWLMDGAAEKPEKPEDPTSKDSQSPEGQAQVRIRNLEDSLFTLQSQLQLLQSASTGAQHKTSGRPAWRRQGHRPLSQPTMEASPAGHTDLDKRASLPAEPMGMSPESPSEPRAEVTGVPGMVGASSEANGPYPGSSPTLEQQLSLGAVAVEGDITAKGGDVVKVVWEGLRATEDCVREATGPELEAKVEEVVLEAIGDRQGAGSPECPSWVREDRGVVEVVWEGLGGSDAEAIRDTMQTSSTRLQEGLEGEDSRDREGAPRGSTGGAGQGDSAGETGSFIWVERVTLSEDWEELLMEGLEGPVAPLGAEVARGEGTWEEEQKWAEESVVVEGTGTEAEPGAERDRVDMPLEVARKGSEVALEPELVGGKEKEWTEKEDGEQPAGVDRKEAEGPLQEKERGEEQLEAEEKEVETLGAEQKGGEGKPEADEEPLVVEREGSEGALHGEEKGGEGPLDTEKRGREPLDTENRGEEPLDSGNKGDEPLERVDKGVEPLDRENKGGEELLDQGKIQELCAEGQRESEERMESQVEEVSQTGPPLEVQQEPMPEEQGLQPGEKQEGSLEEEAAKPHTPEGLPRAATPLLAETPTPEQPAESQPLLQQEGPSANRSGHPAPTYAPAQQPEPAAPTEAGEGSGPKQKTCQCCAVM